MQFTEKEYRLAQRALSALWWKLEDGQMAAEEKFKKEGNDECDFFNTEEYERHQKEKTEVMQLGDKIEQILTPRVIKNIHDVVNSFPYYILRANWNPQSFCCNKESNLLISGDGMGMLYVYIDLEKSTCKFCRACSEFAILFANLLKIPVDEVVGTVTSIKLLKKGIKKFVHQETEKRVRKYAQSEVT